MVLLAGAATGGWLHWSRRPPWEAEPPVPMLRRSHAFVIAVVTSAIFAALAFAMELDGRLVAFDHRIAHAVQEQLGPVLLGVLAAITRLGGSHELVVASALIAVALLLLKQRLLAAGFALSLIGNGLLIRIGKEHFQRIRPIHEHGVVIESGYSFPSGHAAGSLMFYGLLAYVLAVLVPARWHPLILSAAIVVIALIGSSRVLLQVHFVSDVCAGYALAIGWLALCVSAIEFLRSSRKPKVIASVMS